jgi:hypothetical protein
LDGLDPAYIAKMLDKYSHMTEDELMEEIRKVKKASGRDKVTEDEKQRLYQFVQPFLSGKEIEQLKQLLKTFE